jgi:hypothetical protein
MAPVRFLLFFVVIVVVVNLVVSFKGNRKGNSLSARSSGATGPPAEHLLPLLRQSTGAAHNRLQRVYSSMAGGTLMAGICRAYASPTSA